MRTSAWLVGMLGVVACASNSSNPSSAGGGGGTNGETTNTSADGGSGVETTSPTRMSTGVDHTCATRADGATFCWGNNPYGQVGDGTEVDRLAPVKVTADRFAELAAGGTHSCGLLGDGTLRCWGMDAYGTVGTGSTSTRRCDLVSGTTGEPCVLSPTAVVGLTDIVEVSAGTEHTCALEKDGSVWCWGDNRLGQLSGHPTDNYTASPTPARVAGIAAAKHVAAGGNWTCTLLVDGTVSCWGNLPWNQAPPIPTSPITVGAVAGVAGLTDVAEIQISASFGCARIVDGTARCWGANEKGQLGDGTTTTNSAPVTVAGVSNVARVVVGSAHACALLTDGTVTCWGDNGSGALGDGTTTGTDCVPVQGPPPGGGTTGQAGPPTCRPHAASVNGLANVKAIVAGGSHTCVRLADDAISCWGRSTPGLGDGTTEMRTRPVPIALGP